MISTIPLSGVETARGLRLAMIDMVPEHFPMLSFCLAQRTRKIP
jgi:hypothetical protein